MVHLLSQLAKYVVLILFAEYTLTSFLLLNTRMSERRTRSLFARQTRCMFALHFICYLVIFTVRLELTVWLLYAAGVALILVVFLIYRVIYKYAERLIINHMCMLLLIGFIVLTRLNPAYAVRQLEMAALAVVVSIFIPQLIVKFRLLRKFTWVYAAIGIAALGAVLVFSRTSGGAHITFTVGGITFQPSEFVKILFVFYVACMYAKTTEFKQVVLTTVVAALHVMILVASNDLGAALIFFCTYIVMLYVASRKGIYLLGGFGLGALAAAAAGKMFSHVKVRVAAWKDPFANYNRGGYQVAQAMFAIGTGGWFGTGLFQGKPESIPVGSSDFVFAAIGEEFGGIFSICIILVCLSCFIIITNVAMSIQDLFYKLIALGFSCVYGVQVFLNIGGVIKFIPSTGLTLPFVSYGGSSIFVSIFMFAIIQGLYILRHNEGELYASENQIRQIAQYQPQNRKAEEYGSDNRVPQSGSKRKQKKRNPLSGQSGGESGESEEERW